MKASFIRIKSLFDVQKTPDRTLPRRTIIIALSAICLVSVLAHIPLLFGHFVEFDDGSHIFRNPIVKDLTWQHFKEVLFTNFMGRASSPAFAVDILNWRLGGGTYASFAVFNLAWLVFATVLFYRFTALFLGDQMWRLFATLLFSVHSVNVDTVAWMSSRCHFFGGTMVMAALVLWQKYLNEVNRPRRVLYYLFAFLLGGFAIWNKGLFVVVGPLLCVYDLYRKRRITLWAVLDKIPFALVALIPFMHPPISASPEAFLRPSIGPSIEVTLLNDASLFVEYLIRSVLPGPTVIAATVYPQEGLLDTASNGTIRMMGYPPLFNIAVLAIIFFSAFFAMRRYRLKQPFFALLFVTTALLPVMNIPPRWVEFAFRFIYLPSMFVSVALASILAFAWLRLNKKGRFVIAVLMALLIGGHIVQSVLNSTAWRNNTRYWETCVKNFPDSMTCRLKLALDYHDNGRTEDMLETYKEMVYYSVARKPKRAHMPAYHLGREYGNLGDKENACYYFRMAQAYEGLRGHNRKRATNYLSKHCR